VPHDQNVRSMRAVRTVWLPLGQSGENRKALAGLILHVSRANGWDDEKAALTKPCLRLLSPGIAVASSDPLPCHCRTAEHSTHCVGVHDLPEERTCLFQLSCHSCGAFNDCVAVEAPVFRSEATTVTGRMVRQESGVSMKNGAMQSARGFGEASRLYGGAPSLL